jgi:putative membrane protein
MFYTIFGIGALRLLLLLFFWSGLIAAAIFIIRGLFRDNSKKGASNRKLTTLEILDQRYARGDVSREEYELIKKDISESSH